MKDFYAPTIREASWTAAALYRFQSRFVFIRVHSWLRIANRTAISLFSVQPLARSLQIIMEGRVIRVPDSGSPGRAATRHRHRNAELHSAVSPIFNRQAVRSPGAFNLFSP